MLHKIFRKSFRRTHKDYEFGNSRMADQTLIADSDDRISHDGASIMPNGLSGPPIAKQESSPVSELEGSKKVTFNNTYPSSPEAVSGVTVDLFDGNMLEAFQVGDLSIADFLKSPQTTPDMNNTPKKNRSMSDFGVTRTSEMHHISTRYPKKQTLLDRAHSMNQTHSRKGAFSITVSPKVSDNKKTERVKSFEEQACKELKASENCTQVSSNEMVQVDIEKESEKTANRNFDSLCVESKPRFSRSLETLAQEVFGDEFQTYLADASKSPVKVTLAKTEVKSDLISKGSEGSHVVSDKPAVPCRRNVNKPLSKHKSFQDQLLRKKGKTSFSCSTPKDFLQSSGKERVGLRLSHSLDMPNSRNVTAKLEPGEWNKSVDESSLSSMNSFGSDIQNNGEMKIRTSVSTLQNDVSAKASCLFGKSASPTNTIVPISGPYEGVCQRKLGRLSTADSQYVNVGSFNDGDRDKSVSETSIVDIHFPPPPPIDEEFVSVSVEGVLNAVNELSFDHEVSPECLSFNNDVDPLIESLISILPLPENQDELLPALSKAFSEIVSEIISSRRKLKRMMKAIEIHQHVLKEQNKQLQMQSKEMAELRKTAFSINNYHSSPRDFVQTRRKSSDRVVHRQSREMIELNLTLDKLLYQCSALQKTPRERNNDVNDELGDKSLDSVNTSSSVRRVRSFPTRKLKHMKWPNIEDEASSSQL